MPEENKQAELKMGIDVIFLYRLLKNETTEDAWKMAFQTEHNNSKSRSADSIPTKDGNVRKLGEIEYDLSATSLIAKGDPHVDEMDQAFDDGDIIEIWEIDRAEKGTEENSDKYKAKYLQAYLSSFGTAPNAEDELELELEFAVFGKAQRGFATLSEEQAEAVQYAFKDTTKVTVGTDKSSDKKD